MYVYVKNGRIRLKSEERMPIEGYQEYITNHKPTDKLIFENGQVKVYEDSRQYSLDTHRDKLQKELENEKRKNKDLVKIANTKVRKEMELDVKNQEANEYQRKLYLLRNMRGLQQS